MDLTTYRELHLRCQQKHYKNKIETIDLLTETHTTQKFTFDDFRKKKYFCLKWLLCPSHPRGTDPKNMFLDGLVAEEGGGVDDMPI
jgi:hypothetical protein